jgi:hypothetical protein
VYKCVDENVYGDNRLLVANEDTDTVQQHPPDCCCCTFCPGVMVDDLAAPDGVEVEPILRVWGLGRGLLRKA